MLQAGLMMDRPLLISDVIEHAAGQFGDTEIVSREADGSVFRYSYVRCRARALKLANALAECGLSAGTSIGSVALNNHRHMEAYYGVSGSGMIIHTCNPRLHPRSLFTSSTMPTIARYVRSRLRASDGKHRGAVPGGSPLDLSHGRGKHARGHPRDACSAMKNSSARKATSFPGRSSMNARLRRFATPPARRAIRRARCIRIDQSCSMRSLRVCQD